MKEEDEYELVNGRCSYLKKKLEDPNLFQCDDCDFRTFTSKQMMQHIEKTCHKSERFKCKFCDKKSLLLKTLFKHMEDMHPLERFRCDDCEYIGVSYQALARHTQVIHLGKSFSCEQCPYKTTTLCNVQIHTARVHCDSPSVPCKFHTCDYQGNRLALIDHMKRIHKACQICEYEPNSVMDKAMQTK